MCRDLMLLVGDGCRWWRRPTTMVPVSYSVTFVGVTGVVTSENVNVRGITVRWDDIDDGSRFHV